MSSTPTRPLGDVLAHRSGDFVPQHPERAPWWQPRSIVDEVAATDNRAVVPLLIADRVQLARLGRPTGVRDDLEPSDWTPQGFGVPSP